MRPANPTPRPSAPPRAAVLVAGLALAAPFAGGCAALPGLAGGEAPERARPVEVTVQELPGEDLWQVGYRLPAPAAGVELVRAGNAFRAAGWTVAAPGAAASWHGDGSREWICFDRPADAVAVAFRTDIRHLPKDYELHLATSDGGRLLFTGHLELRPLVTCTPEATTAQEGTFPHRWRLLTSAERPVRVLDRVAPGELLWEPEGEAADSDTYVVFGGLPAVEAGGAVAVVDPGLPPWMRHDLEATFSRLVERYAGVTGVALASPPLLVFAWDEGGGDGRWFSGGSLPGLIVASASGAGWREEGPAARRAWARWLAHEAFHLWDHQGFRPDEAAEWLSEAAAETFGAQALVALEILPPEALHGWLVERANACLARLGGRSVVAAPAAGDFEAWYACGAVALAAADGALLRAAPEQGGLAALFRELAAQARRTDGTYGTGAFLGWLEHLGGGAATVGRLQALLREGVPESADLLVQALLAEAGVATELVPPEEAPLDDGTWAALVRRAVGRCHCGDQTTGCDPVAEGARVSTVAGVPLGAEPREAWSRLRQAIEWQRSLTVATGDGLDTTLFCGPDSFDPSWSGLLRLPAPTAPEP